MAVEFLPFVKHSNLNEMTIVLCYLQFSHTVPISMGPFGYDKERQFCGDGCSSKCCKSDNSVEEGKRTDFMQSECGDIWS